MFHENKEQEKAIKTINQNVAVNAGAGTGKTKVLTERYVEILDRGNLEKNKEVESIVAITFTNKATQEMIERIREEVAKKIKKESKNNKKWKRYYRDLEKANISTIHGFCSKILRENPVEANINPYFEILDETKSNKLLQNSIISVLEKNFRNNESFFNFLRLSNITKLEYLVDDFESAYNKIRTTGNSIENVRKQMQKKLSSIETDENDITLILDKLNYLVSNFNKNTKIGRFQKDDIYKRFKKQDYDANSKFDFYDDLQYLRNNLGNSKKYIEVQSSMKDLMDKVLKTREKDFEWMYYLVLDILEEIDMEYTNIKRIEGVVDYDDLQIMTLNLLENKDILNKYHKKFKYFMIDEFQDTNELQKKIFYKLTSVEKDLDRENLFIVGDPKQSIYRFRGAEVEVFEDVVEDIRRYNSKNVIDLKTNYRSLDKIMNHINSIFIKLMGDNYISLEGFKKSDRDIKIEILSNENISNNTKHTDSLFNSIYEADLIAKRIRKLVDVENFNYGDIALLFRTTKRNYIYETALSKYDIPYFNSGSKNFFSKQEIKDLVNILKVIDNPKDEVSLIGYLRSPMVGVNDETIYYLFNNRIKRDFNNLLENLDKIKDKKEKEKLISGIKNLKYLYNIKSVYNIVELINICLEKTNYLESLLLNPNGEQEIANIYKFINLLDEYFTQNPVSLDSFIDYIEEIKNSDIGEEIIEAENSNIVKLMTIHGSKGLEFPVVIIPEMAKKSGGISSGILYNKDLGLGLRNDYLNINYSMINNYNNKKESEEDERILYVAMTRAEEYLILGQQGSNSGYKKILKPHINDENIKKIESIDLDTPKKEILNLKKKNYIFVDGSQKEPDLLYQIDGYGFKNIERYTISQYMDYMNCKRKFFYRYIWEISVPECDSLDKIDTESSSDYIDGLTRGNIVHYFIENYDIDIDVEKLIIKSLNKYGQKINNQNINYINRYIQNYLIHHPDDFDNIYNEKPFYIKLGEGLLYGIIDRIVIKNGEIEITDFKTNKLDNKNKLVDQYKTQLQTYAFATEKIFNKKIKSASILFLEDGSNIKINTNKESLENNFNKLEEFAKYINTYQSIKHYNQIENCNYEYCEYRNICKKIKN